MRDVDELDALRLWIEYNSIPFTHTNICVEDKMRFESVEVRNESLNEFFGDAVYTIKDNVDSNSPVRYFRLLKPTADKVCDWLNSLVDEEAESFEDKVKRVIKYLWDDDEYQYFVVDGMHIVIEIEETGIGVNQLREALPDAIITYKDISCYKTIFFIKEDK